MTEEEWLMCIDPGPMLEFLRGKVSERKLRLLACSCCHRCIHLVPPESLDDEGRPWVDLIQQAVSVGEKLADGKTVRQDEPIPGIAWTCVDGWYAFLSCASPFDDLLEVPATVAWAVAGLVSNRSQLNSHNENNTGAEKAEREAQISLVRDIFPFRPITISSSWLTSTVISLAQGIYTDRAFDRMPILADALQDAGCSNDEILNHCRRPGTHTRGCFVIDLLTGRQ